MTITVTVSQPSEGVGLVAFGDPPMNFGTPELDDAIVRGVQEVQDAGCRVVVLASDTPGYFIAHWSLQWIMDAFDGSSPPPRGPRVYDLFERSPLVAIAAINGQCWGGGAEMAWGCDLRVAAQSATFGQPEVAIGILAAGGGTTRLARLIGHSRCLELVLDGRPITAAQAYDWGAVNRVVSDDRVREEAIAWAAHIARWPAAALAATKASVIAGREVPLREARRNEGLAFCELAPQAEARELLRAAQARYDSGAGSLEALCLPI